MEQKKNKRLPPRCSSKKTPMCYTDGDWCYDCCRKEGNRELVDLHTKSKADSMRRGLYPL